MVRGEYREMKTEQEIQNQVDIFIQGLVVADIDSVRAIQNQIGALQWVLAVDKDEKSAGGEEQ